MLLYHELKRRNVFRVAIAYLALAWLLIEVAGTLFPGFGIPDWAFRFVVIVLAFGFIPTLVFSWAFEITPEGVKREQDVVRDDSITHVTAKRLDGITIGLIVVALAFILADRFWLSPRFAQQVESSSEVANDTVQPTLPEPAHNQDQSKSIAVLPFVNMSDDASNEYFSDGISEELLNLLSKIPELRVISRSSAFAFKGEKVNIPEVAQKLNVTHVLEGSVRKAGKQVRITAQLIEAPSDTHLWSESYDRTLDDIFTIQDEIAGAVVDALKLTLFGKALQAEPMDSEAYTLYLQAVHIGAHLTPEALERSNALLNQVLAIAPDFARAWRLLARNYAVQADKLLLPRDQATSLAREAIMQALASDPNLAEAHSWLGNFEAENGGDLIVSARRLQHALQLEPNNLVVISHCGNFLKRLGRLDEAIAIQEYELTRDPLNPITHSNLAWNYLAAGQRDEAIAAVHTLQMLSPDHDWAHSLLSMAFLIKGENEAALRTIQQESDETSRLNGLVRAHHALGQVVESNAVLNELIEKYGRDNPYSIASVLAYRGEIDRSFTWLDKAASFRAPPIWIAEKIWFTNLYDDPRWLPFLESIGRSPAHLDAIEFKVSLPGILGSG